MKRFAYFVYVNLDPTPGAFHTPDSALANVRGILENRLGHYEPTVGFAPDDLQPETLARDHYRRLALVIYINLDAVDSDKMRGLRMVRTALRDVILHYQPVVSYARREMQPDYIEGIITA